MSLTTKTESDEQILKFSTFAVADIKGTWQYVSEQSEQAARKLIREITEKCTFLANNPKVGRERNELMINLRHFPLQKLQYLLFSD